LVRLNFINFILASAFEILDKNAKTDITSE